MSSPFIDPFDQSDSRKVSRISDFENDLVLETHTALAKFLTALGVYGPTQNWMIRNFYQPVPLDIIHRHVCLKIFQVLGQCHEGCLCLVLPNVKFDLSTRKLLLIRYASLRRCDKTHRFEKISCILLSLPLFSLS